MMPANVRSLTSGIPDLLVLKLFIIVEDDVCDRSQNCTVDFSELVVPSESSHCAGSD